MHCRTRTSRSTTIAALLACCTVALAWAATRGDVPAEPPASPAPTYYDRAEDHDAYDWDKWRQHWAFRPIERTKLPEVKDEAWVRNAIDAFVLAKLEAAGLKPAPEADKYALIRRATYDLTGLPPTPQEIRAFIADKSPDAYEQLIERLLSSPHYGERWGRHWLDVARYVPGRVQFVGVKNTSGDSHYRDYVVRAFNSDKPYDRFLTEQLAGDLLPAPQGEALDRESHFDRIAAPAFLSIGAWFDMDTDPNRLRLEMVDEMVNATSQAFMGLSVSCARCHDHKHDPIPTSDYYALAGVFRSTRLVGGFSEYWRDGRVRQLRPLAMPDEVAANDTIRAEIDRRKQEQWRLKVAAHKRLVAAWKQDEEKYRSAAEQLTAPFVHSREAEHFDGQDNLRIADVTRDGKALQVIETQTPTDQWVKYEIDVPATGEYRLEALYSSDDSTPVVITVNGGTEQKTALDQPTGGWELKYQRWTTAATVKMRYGLNFMRLIADRGNFPRIDRLRLVRVDEDLTKKLAEQATAYGIDPRLLDRFVTEPEQPWPTIAGIDPFIDTATQKKCDELSAEMARLSGTIKPYPLIVAVTDQPEATDLPIHLRGNTYRTTKSLVQRGTIRLFDDQLAPPKIEGHASGRLELAKWLTHPKHPLTSRVMVNRLWHWHFGHGLVATPSDFGSHGTPPTHPELLDWLASEFMARGWSMKAMHRLIMTSSTYRMSSERSARGQQADPDNLLLSRFNRRRLEVEAIYDTMLSTINKLVRQEPGTDLEVERSKDRMLYVLTSGRAPKGLGVEIRKMWPLFDYDPSGVPQPARATSVTPAQSLFWLNNPLPAYYADKFAERLLKMDKLVDRQRVNEAYMLAIGRMPSVEINEAAQVFVHGLEAEGLSKQEAWAMFCRTLYASNEFRYVE